MTGERYQEPTCQELAELITDYLEGVLAPEQHALFDLHLSECPDCTLYVEQMRTTIIAAGRIGVDDIPPVVRNELLAAFSTWSAGR
jgi:predicted anti-sigma-YlaC factor YlaD